MAVSMELCLRLRLSLSINVVIVPNQGHVDRNLLGIWALTFHQVAEYPGEETHYACRWHFKFVF